MVFCGSGSILSPLQSCVSVCLYVCQCVRPCTRMHQSVINSCFFCCCCCCCSAWVSVYRQMHPSGENRALASFCKLYVMLLKEKRVQMLLCI